MNERKILLFVLSVIFYCLYSVHMWFMKENIQGNNPNNDNKVTPQVIPKDISEKVLRRIVKAKVLPLYIKDACSALEIFTVKPPVKRKSNKLDELSVDNNTITVIGITVFLIILVLNAVLDVLKVKEEERARRKLNPDGERRQSLSEFANKKTLKRESSKFGLQLFQIAESFVSSDEDKKNKRQNRPYKRGDSTNSYLSDRKSQIEGSAPASIGEIPTGESRLVKRQSVAKLFGLSDD